jgi:hypothetical protein
VSDKREDLVRLDAYLGRAWAKAEILIGLTVLGTGLFLGIFFYPTFGVLTISGYSLLV